MKDKIETIGVLTSGGDAPGMNAGIRAVVRTAISKGMKVVGIKRGYNGLINGDVVDMEVRSVSEIIHRGGTILYTARCLEFMEEAGQIKAAETCAKHNIDAVVVLGGDGSFRGAMDLHKQGIPCIGVPCTIDNDISCTDYTIGFDSAMNTAIEMIDKLRDTTQSHDRCSVVEVMGRKAGYLALEVGIATGALVTLIPEVKWSITKDVIARIEKTKKEGKRHFIVMVAEGAGDANEIAKQIQAATGIESRATILGHVQRGGSPTVIDRVAATRLGYRAVELLEHGVFNRIVGLKSNAVVDYGITEALAMEKTIDPNLLKIEKAVSR